MSSETAGDPCATLPYWASDQLCRKISARWYAGGTRHCGWFSMFPPRSYQNRSSHVEQSLVSKYVRSDFDDSKAEDERISSLISYLSGLNPLLVPKIPYATSVLFLSIRYIILHPHSLSQADKYHPPSQISFEMLSTRVSTRLTARTLSKTFGQIATGSLVTRGTTCAALHQINQNKRMFKTSSRPFFNTSSPKSIAEDEVKNMKEFKERSWPHPVYTQKEMKDIVSIRTAC